MFNDVLWRLSPPKLNVRCYVATGARTSTPARAMLLHATLAQQ